MQYVHGLKMALYSLLVAFVLFPSLNAQTLDLTEGVGVEFNAVGKPSMISITGTGGKAVGQLALKDGSASGEFTVDLNSFTTDMDTRDEHMKEKYLETSKEGFDKAILKISQKGLNIKSFPLEGTWAPKNLKGLLTLHGVTKEVLLVPNVSFNGASAKGEVSFKIRLQDYAIEIPSFAGVTVADEVTAVVKIDDKVIR
jgi:polyisoprenoid-binding protein YceI